MSQQDSGGVTDEEKAQSRLFFGTVRRGKVRIREDLRETKEALL